MSPRHQWFVFFVKTFAASVIFIMTGFIVFVVGPVIETKFLPPVSKLQILSMEATPDGQTIIHAAFVKHRDCEYIGIAWYRGTRATGFERVPIILQRSPGDDSSPNRPVGYQTAGPWIVDMPMSEIKNNSFVELFHRCHAFWLTRTEFYP